MKTFFVSLIPAVFLFGSVPAMAEYDKVYCGSFKRVEDVAAFDEQTVNFNYLLDMTETCVLEDAEEVTYAGIYATGEEKTKIEKILASSRKSTRWCVSARWSGSDPCIFPSGGESISTRTESISRIGRRSSFGPDIED